MKWIQIQKLRLADPRLREGVDEKNNKTRPTRWRCICKLLHFPAKGQKPSAYFEKGLNDLLLTKDHKCTKECNQCTNETEHDAVISETKQ